ncbi:MAG TPA: hypothetical protein VHV49_17810 [Pseudonocardiaceae bacterium]|jgi:hypothetical protein|nr:hypothetical protein [Pseudonocardiaceae bacterium]
MDTPTATDRVVREAGGDEVVDRLVGLSGADLTTLLLRVMRLRADRLTPADVARRYRSDRFVAPASVPFQLLRRTEDRLLSLLPDGFEPVTLAPVVPLGTHSVLGTVHQNKVLATVRGTEVAADATNGLALVAADRRAGSLAADARSARPVRLAAVQRLVRAQQEARAGRFAHFGLVGFVTAGRDTGDLAFELRHVVAHVRYLVRAVLELGGGGVELRLAVARPRLAPVGAAVRDAFAGRCDVTVVDDPDRVAAGGYYDGLCYKLFAVRGDTRREIGDGGLVDWTRLLLGNNKERLVIGGIGVEALATL